MCMRSGNGGNPAVQKIAHRQFFGSRFGMHVDQNGRNVPAQRVVFQKFFNRLCRTVDGFHKQPPQQLNHQKLFAVRKLDFRRAAAGQSFRIVKRPDDLFAFVQKGNKLALLPDVIAGNQHVDAII